MAVSDTPPLIDKKLRDQFIIEIKEDIEKLESDLLTMEKDTSDTDSEVINHGHKPCISSYTQYKGRSRLL